MKSSLSIPHSREWERKAAPLIRVYVRESYAFSTPAARPSTVVWPYPIPVTPSPIAPARAKYSGYVKLRHAPARGQAETD